jgi:hypothetical protein
MKTFILVFIFLLLIGGEGYSQNPYLGNNTGMNFGGFMNNFGGGTPNGNMMLGSAAATMSQGSYLVDQSQANINNQTVESMHYDNRLKRTRTFFENRQINGYYRDIEEWQKNTRRQLRGAGLYDREAIEYIYGINKP